MRSRKDELEEIIAAAEAELSDIKKAENLSAAQEINDVLIKKCFKRADGFDGPERVLIYSRILRAEGDKLFGHDFYRAKGGKLVIRLDAPMGLTIYGYQSGHGEINPAEFESAWQEVLRDISEISSRPPEEP